MPDYTFEGYFYPDHTTGRILVREGLSPEDRQRAEDTLEVYGLDDPRHWPMRLRILEYRSKLTDWPLDQFAYRDFLGPAIPPETAI